MENYPPYTTTFPDSATSSPRSLSRDLDFDPNPNPTPPWDDQPNPNPNPKVKFMVSYNGKIQPRPHDNLLSYIGGDTKILSVDRSVSFSTLFSKLSSLVSSPDNSGDGVDFSFKYQLPGEDLDALISVTNDDDLEHLMHEYDRLSKGTNKPARLRLFLFFDQKSRRNSGSAFSSVSSEPGNKLLPGSGSGLDRVVSDPVEVVASPQMQMQMPVQNNVDFLFGLDKVVPVQPPGPNPVQNHEMVHEMNRIHLLQMQQQQQQQQSQPVQQEYHQHQQPPQLPQQIAANVQQQSPQMPPGYWQQQLEQQQRQILLQQQQEFHQQPPQIQQEYRQNQQPPLYMMHAPPQPQPPPTNVYHAPPILHQPNQPYYQQIQQRMQSDQGVFMEQQPIYTTPAGIPAGNAAAYENSAGRQVYYAGPTPAQGCIVGPAFSGVAMATTVPSSGGEMRGSGDGKVVQKIVTNPSVV